MNIKDHGDFVRYDPTEHPLKLHKVQFCRRVSDGRDWYEILRELRGTDTVKMTVIDVDGDPVVMATSRDASMLFPAGCRLIEVSGVIEDHESFRNKHFDGKAFHEKKPKPPLPTIIDILIEELGLDAEKLRRKVDAARKKAGERKHG